MFIEIIIALVIGLLLGMITGLTPGIHINLISVIIFSLSPVLLKFTTSEALAVTITSMAVTHTFIDTIPSIFLGAPEGDTALSVLPGHRLLLQGKGHEAVMLTVLGSLFALTISVCLVPLVILVVSNLYPIIKSYIGYAILSTVVFLLYKERKLWALIIFFITGVLGIAVLNINNLAEPLFPLFSGLFGTSMLILSIKDNTKVPPQKRSDIGVGKSVCAKAVSASVISGWVCSFMPGLGPSQAAVLASQFTKNLGSKGFLVLVGGLSTVNMTLSFVTVYALDKARNGAVITIMELIGSFDLMMLAILLGVALVVGGLAVILASVFSGLFSKIMSKVNYRIVCLFIISLIVVLVCIISGYLGLVVLIVSTFVGILPALRGVGRNNMMGCLLLPIMLFFLL